MQAIQGVLQFIDVVAHYMGIDFRGLHIRMTQKFLQGANIGPMFQHVCREGMPQGVYGSPLVDSRFFYRGLDRFLQAGLEHMMPSLLAVARVNRS